MTLHEKAFVDFAKGINTEASLVNWPDGFSADEQNLILAIDGSRSRREGLGLEEGGIVYANPHTVTQDHVVKCFKWEDVGGDPALNFIMVQIGATIHIYLDSETLSQGKILATIALTPYALQGTTAHIVATTPVDMTYGKGNMYIASTVMDPIWIKYTPSPASFTVTKINLQTRDFDGIDDGVGVSIQPLTITQSHEYNLLNRGWTVDQINAFFSAQAVYPSKAMDVWLGLQSTKSSLYADTDGVKNFSPAKLVSELFGDASAPTGNFILSPFNTSEVALPGLANQVPIASWSIDSTAGGVATITVTTVGVHGLIAAATVSVSGQSASYLSTAVGSGIGIGPNFSIYFPYFTFNGDQTVLTVPDTTHFTFSITNFPVDFSSWLVQYQSLGTASNSLIPNPSGYVSTTRPKTIAFFGGRLFYAGTPDQHLSAKIFFSQIIEEDDQYGKCYQQASPTDYRINDIVATDGGVIVIPELGDVVDIQPYGDVLLIFASNGVWSVGPGQKNYFTADSYGVRKVTDQGCVGPATIVMAKGNIPMYWGISDIFFLVQDPQSGLLRAENLTENIINSLYNEVPRSFKALAQGVYDDLNKRVIWTYGNPNDGNDLDYNYNRALVYDTRNQAFTKYNFGVSGVSYVGSLVALKDIPIDSAHNKVKWLGITGAGTTVTWADFNDNVQFKDWGISEQPAYLLTGYDVSAGYGLVGTAKSDPSKYRVAPWIWVFLGKTETGYTVSGSDYAPVGASSVYMLARWDWADQNISGKWGRPQQVYRHARPYVPADPTTDGFDDGQPVVITRNKVRGRGRTLQVMFQAGPESDMELLGWRVQFDVNGK